MDKKTANWGGKSFISNVVDVTTAVGSGGNVGTM